MGTIISIFELNLSIICEITGLLEIDINELFKFINFDFERLEMPDDGIITLYVIYILEKID